MILLHKAISAFYSYIGIMSDPNTIRFSKKVDDQGRLVIPQEHRKALGITVKRPSLSSKLR
jgi:hypothetical protein